MNCSLIKYTVRNTVQYPTMITVRVKIMSNLQFPANKSFASMHRSNQRMQ